MTAPTATIHTGDALAVLATLPAASVHMAITSPPYWQQKSYNVPPVTFLDGWTGELGQEPSPLRYVDHVAMLCAQIRRVLRDDGSLWLNLGDTYASTAYPDAGLKPQDLCGIPHRVAFALQRSGWYLRQEVVWHKTNPATQKVDNRPTTAHEYVFLLTKLPGGYYYDKLGSAAPNKQIAGKPNAAWLNQNGRLRGTALPAFALTGDTHNRRSVWSIAVGAPGSGEHIAPFPLALAQIAILAGTSAAGVCRRCGSPWQRRLERTPMGTLRNVLAASSRYTDANGQGDQPILKHGVASAWKRAHPDVDHGFSPTCDCDTEPFHSTVLDPFSGSGTAGVAARLLGRSYVGIELDPEVAERSRARIEAQG